MKKSFLLLLGLLAFACSPLRENKASKVLIIKQWHLSPKANTLNVAESRRAGQYQNQTEIYKLLTGRLAAGDLTLITEGCEAGSEIDENFPKVFNGWSFANLSFHKDKTHYPDILTHIPLKLKAKYPHQVKAFCGDNEELMKQNQLDLSEAKGFLGFYFRLEESKNNPRKYNSYLKALAETQKGPVKDPLKFTEEQALAHVAAFWKGMALRNAGFVKLAKQKIHENPVIVIGGLHVKDLEKQLKAEGLEVEVYTPEGYPQESEDLGQQLTKVFGK